MTIILTHADCLNHDPGPEHPERPARLTTVVDALKIAVPASAAWRDAPLADLIDLGRAHSAHHIKRVQQAVPKAGLWNLDADTIVSPGSLQAALRAAGAVCAAVDAVCAGPATTAFCAVRPPGHHAERQHALGFCLFNNLAIGALRARAVHGRKRIALIDFDVHHGNGAQNILWADPDALVISVHQWPLDLPTGAGDETGAYRNVLNMPLPKGAGSYAFRAALTGPVAEAVQRFQPDIVLVAAGFDGHRDDPLGGLDLVAGDFGWAGSFLTRLAQQVSEGRLVASLEGGYDLSSLAASARAFVTGIVEQERR